MWTNLENPKGWKGQKSRFLDWTSECICWGPFSPFVVTATWSFTATFNYSTTFTTILHFILFFAGMTSKYKGTLQVQKNTGCIFGCVGVQIQNSLVSQGCSKACSSLEQKLITIPSVLLQTSPEQDLWSLEVVERLHTSQTIRLWCNKQSSTKRPLCHHSWSSSTTTSETLEISYKLILNAIEAAK